MIFLSSMWRFYAPRDIFNLHVIFSISTGYFQSPRDIFNLHVIFSSSTWCFYAPCDIFKLNVMFLSSTNWSYSCDNISSRTVHIFKSWVYGIETILPSRDCGTGLVFLSVMGAFRQQGHEARRLPWWTGEISSLEGEHCSNFICRIV